MQFDLEGFFLTNLCSTRFSTSKTVSLENMYKLKVKKRVFFKYVFMNCFLSSTQFKEPIAFLVAKAVEN